MSTASFCRSSSSALVKVTSDLENQLLAAEQAAALASEAAALLESRTLAVEHAKRLYQIRCLCFFGTEILLTAEDAELIAQYS